MANTFTFSNNTNPYASTYNLLPNVYGTAGTDPLSNLGAETGQSNQALINAFNSALNPDYGQLAGFQSNAANAIANATPSAGDVNALMSSALSAFPTNIPLTFADVLNSGAGGFQGQIGNPSQQLYNNALGMIGGTNTGTAGGGNFFSNLIGSLQGSTAAGGGVAPGSKMIDPEVAAKLFPMLLGLAQSSQQPAISSEQALAGANIQQRNNLTAQDLSQQYANQNMATAAKYANINQGTGEKYSAFNQAQGNKAGLLNAVTTAALRPGQWVSGGGGGSGGGSGSGRGGSDGGSGSGGGSADMGGLGTLVGFNAANDAMINSFNSFFSNPAGGYGNDRFGTGAPSSFSTSPLPAGWSSDSYTTVTDNGDGGGVLSKDTAPIG